ncbi:MAG: cytochrome c family protein [Desulfobacterales bacterium]|nr:cytochrome c family protein [Desulfobacterales bacterium]
MIRKLVVTVMAFLFVFSSVGVCFALEKGNKRKGKYTYRKVYKACFERGAVESKTPPISPADKTQAEWEALFTSKDYSQFGCDEEWTNLNDTQVKDIYAYLYDHASDSPTPAKCK